MQRRDDVLLGECLDVLINFEPELTVNFVPADGGEVVSAGFEEHAIEEVFGGGVGRGVAGPNAGVDFAVGVFDGEGGVLAAGVDNGGVVGDFFLIEEFDVLDAGGHEAIELRFGQLIADLGQDLAGVGIDDIGGDVATRQIVGIVGLAGDLNLGASEGGDIGGVK